MKRLGRSYSVQRWLTGGQRALIALPHPSLLSWALPPPLHWNFLAVHEPYSLSLLISLPSKWEDRCEQTVEIQVRKLVLFRSSDTLPRGCVIPSPSSIRSQYGNVYRAIAFLFFFFLKMIYVTRVTWRDPLHQRTEAARGNTQLRNKFTLKETFRASRVSEKRAMKYLATRVSLINFLDTFNVSRAPIVPSNKRRVVNGNAASTMIFIISLSLSLSRC